MNSSLHHVETTNHNGNAPALGLGDIAARSLRVLVVEDTPINQEVVRRLLERRGHQVVIVNDGEQGLAEWRKGGFDLILMDIQMPVMDGATATRRIRAGEITRGGHIPIIAMTAHAIKGIEEECLAYGMDGYVAKPLVRGQFISLVESFSPCSQTAATQVLVGEAPQGMVSRSLLVENANPLVRTEKMAEYVGNDPETQQQVVDMCLADLRTKVPLLQRAMNKNDLTTIQRITHCLRGSLGLLGLPAFLTIAEEVECRRSVLGADVWQLRCEQLYDMLKRIEVELRQLRAA